MINYKDGQEYWNGNLCTKNYLRELADKMPEIYYEYRRNHREYLEFHTVATCHCGCKWVVDDSAIPSKKDFEEECPLCGTVILLKKSLDGKSYPKKNEDAVDTF